MAPGPVSTVLPLISAGSGDTSSIVMPHCTSGDRSAQPYSKRFWWFDLPSLLSARQLRWGGLSGFFFLNKPAVGNSTVCSCRGVWVSSVCSSWYHLPQVDMLTRHQLTYCREPYKRDVIKASAMPEQAAKRKQNSGLRPLRLQWDVKGNWD